MYVCVSCLCTCGMCIKCMCIYVWYVCRCVCVCANVKIVVSSLTHDTKFVTISKSIGCLNQLPGLNLYIV